MNRRKFIAGLGAAAWPLAARAQQPAMPVVGFLSGTGPDFKFESPHLHSAFLRGLGEYGLLEGRDFNFVVRSAEARYDQLPALAADLVSRRVAVIVATGGSAPALAAKATTATIPIIFTTAADPVALGLVSSLNRPGGNVTGVSFLAEALVAKRLEMLHEIVPAAALVGYLVNPGSPQVEARIAEAGGAARLLGVRLMRLNAGAPDEIEGAFANIAAQHINALLVDADPLYMTLRDQIVALSARRAVPAIYQVREIADAGGLMSYGASLPDVFRLAGIFAGRILKGEKPADLPVQQSTKIELVINLKTAKALGITFPLSLLGRADEVIE